ncbi:hypothetical protein ACH5RR_024820 [Cinchona calisaya]|uniref:Uncharacterized protein n=1 Tax=Cinchona calisaya TaxID=153742 RepID=A0ABD2Z2X2_9GENT
MSPREYEKREKPGRIQNGKRWEDAGFPALSPWLFSSSSPSSPLFLLSGRNIVSPISSLSRKRFLFLPKPSDRSQVQSKQVRIPDSGSIKPDYQDVQIVLKLSDDLHLNEIDSVCLLVSANQERSFLGRDPYGNVAPCGRTLAVVLDQGN